MKTEVESPSTKLRSLPHAVLAAVLVALFAMQSHERMLQVPAIDFFHFWIAPHYLERFGAQEFYPQISQGHLDAEVALATTHGRPSPRRDAAAQLWKPGAENTSGSRYTPTPFLYTVFGAVLGSDYERDYRSYSNLILILTLLSVFTMSYLYGLGAACTGLVAVGFLELFAPLRSDFNVGNVNALLLTVCTVSLVLCHQKNGARSQLAEGALFGLAVAFKPIIVFVPALSLITRWGTGRRRECATYALGLLCGGVLALVLSMIYFGSPGVWLAWSKALASVSDDAISVDKGNYSLMSLAGSALGLKLTSAAALVLFGAVAYVLLRLSARGGPEVPKSPRSMFQFDSIAIAAGLLVYLLSAKLVWLHYYVLAIPAIVLVLAYGLDSVETRNDRRMPAIAAASIASLFGFMGYSQLDWSSSTPPIVIFNVGVWLLLVHLLFQAAGLSRPAHR